MNKSIAKAEHSKIAETAIRQLKKLSADRLPAALKYKLYSDAVQSPQESVESVENIYSDIFSKRAESLREDFCGTFRVGCQWVRSGPQRRAVGVNLDDEPLRFASQNKKNLLPEARERAVIRQQDVRVPTIPRADIILAENFSFYIFKTRKELLSYFRSAYSSLQNEGMIILDMVGGRQFAATPHDSRRTLDARTTGLPVKVVYRWRQRRFNPVSNEAAYYIDFRIGDRWYLDVFQYDWRVWSIPEVSEALKEAGFSEVACYWEEDRTNGSYLRRISKISAHWETWLCSVVGIKR